MKRIEKRWLDFANMVPFSREDDETKSVFYTGAASVLQIITEISYYHKGNADLINFDLTVVQQEVIDFFKSEEDRMHKLEEKIIREAGGNDAKNN